MNKYSLKLHLQQELAPFTSTLKATSFDKENQQHLCNDEQTTAVYDFDAYVKERCIHPTPASPDAIHAGNKDLYFVEFKNQRAANVDKEQMQKKFRSGTQILKDLLNDFGARDCKYHFCVVLKNQTKPRYMDYRHIERSIVKFGLDALNRACGDFYDSVVTESLDFYIRTFNSLRC